MDRGDLYLADLGTPIGHEAGQQRPVLLISASQLHRTRLCIILPLTRTKRDYPSYIEVEGVVRETSYIQCEQPRTISTQRLLHRVGHLDAVTLLKVQTVLKHLLDLP